jgi:hypothetical protein
MNLDKVNKPNISSPNVPSIPMNEEQRMKLQNVKNKAAQKINQGSSFIDSNLLSKFKNKNFNGEKLKEIGIFDTFKNVVSEMVDYFIEYMPEFSIKISVMIIGVIIYFSLGGGMLYICKISQTNFLPVFSECFPYSDTKVDLKDITTNIFTQTLNDEKVSMNLKFKFEDNNKNVLLDAIRKYKTSNKANVVLVYLLSIVNALFSFNYNFINTVFSNLNGLNDLIVIILSPIIYILCFIFLFFSNNIYFIFLWFYKMAWFFKKNQNCGKGKKKAKWVPVEMMYNPTDFFIGSVLTMFACMFSLGVFISLFINPFFSVPTITMVYSMFSSMIFKGEIKDKSVNIFTIIKYVFKHYKLPMFLILSLFTIFRSNISEKIFKLYEEYNENKTSILGRFGDNLMKMNKDVNKMNDISNKMDLFNVRDKVDVIGKGDTMDENTRKLQNQINAIKTKNRNLINTQNKIGDKLEDAYNVNTPFTIVVLCILFSIISSLGMFKVKDYSMFSSMVEFETNDIECDGENEDEDGDHTAVYKTYMMGKSIWNAYQNAVKEKQEEETINPSLKNEVSKEFYGTLKDESIKEYNKAVDQNSIPDKGRNDAETNVKLNANTKPDVKRKKSTPKKK